MKLILVSNPDAIANENEIVNQLFDEGLEIFHLRKPTYEKKDIIDFLSKIKSKYHSKITLHQHHTLTEQFEINRIHYTEKDRLKANTIELKKLKDKNFTISTSIHFLNDHESLSESFSYTFFGPLFESISKQGYKPKSNQIVQLSKNENRPIKIIAIGGITSNKIERAKQFNFDGVALLGTIWNKPENAIKNFRECLRIVNM